MSGEYYSDNTGPLSGNPVNGQRGGNGAPSAIYYGAGVWEASGGSGGFGGRGGGNDGAKGNGGAGGGSVTTTSGANFRTAGKDGTDGNAVTVSVKAPGGPLVGFLKQSGTTGAYQIPTLLGNYGDGGAAGTSDRDNQGNGRPADDGKSGVIIIFFFYDI